MAVYKRNYRRYEGPLTSERWRFNILRRYALKSIFETRINTALFVACFFPHLVALVLIYLLSNLEALALMDLPVAPLRFFSVNGTFFLTLFRFQAFLSFVLVALMGPGLVSPDLVNNALPLYFSRPFSRAEYVLGKLAVLLTLTSLVTWIPGLLLILIQGSLAGFPWVSDNVRIIFGVVLGSWIWILTISLIALAISAWVRWRPVAIASLFGIFFVAAGFGTAANEILETRWGVLLNLTSDILMVWRWLFLSEASYRVPFSGLVPAWTGLAALLAVCGAALFMLRRKVRAVQEVR